MKNIYHSLLVVIAEATQKELARQIKYLKVENEILRSRLPTRSTVTPKERNRLVKFAGKLTAKMLKGLVSIVHPETLLRWVREEQNTKTQHMDVICREYLAFYHTESPHQGRDNELLMCESPPKYRKSNSEVLKLSDISCNLRLGGLLKHYYRQAA